MPGAQTVTVGGLPGTGTSTLCRILQGRLEKPYVYAGQIFRAEAERRGLDLEEMGRLCETDPSIDQALDAEQVRLLRGGGIILEGRMAGWLAHREEIRALKVWVVCDEDERMRRLVQRDGGTLAEQLERTRRREQSEQDRYQRYYGADLRDMSIYDVVLDSTRSPPEELAHRVLAALPSERPPV